MMRLKPRINKESTLRNVIDIGANPPSVLRLRCNAQKHGGLGQPSVTIAGSGVNEVSTTCGSGWVSWSHQGAVVICIVDPPATAGGTDMVSQSSNSGRSSPWP